jgi:hypothetical protein
MTKGTLGCPLFFALFGQCTVAVANDGLLGHLSFFHFVQRLAVDAQRGRGACF